MAVAELLFGRNIGSSLGVSEADFQAFLDSEVTTRFPEGFTVLDANGQWRDAQTATIVREQTKLLVIAMPPDGDGDRRTQAVAEAYKQRFQQKSVLVLWRRVCGGF